MREAPGWIGVLGGFFGALGGAAGSFAYFDQRRQRKRLDSVAHIDPDLRPLLLRILSVSLDIEERQRDQEWIEKNLGPLMRELRPLAHVSVAAIRGDFKDFASVGLYMKTILLGDYEAGSQGMYAHRLTDSATVILHRLYGSTSRLGPTNPDLPNRDVFPL